VSTRDVTRSRLAVQAAARTYKNRHADEQPIGNSHVIGEGTNGTHRTTCMGDARGVIITT